MNLVQHIIFDLDGTLWNTAESYLYAYEKLCKLFPHSFTRTKEEIWKLLGIPLEDVIHSLQEFQVPKEQLAYDALTFSMEYIMFLLLHFPALQSPHHTRRPGTGTEAGRENF